MWSASVIYVRTGIRFEELDWNKEKFWVGTDQITRKLKFLLKLYANLVDQTPNFFEILFGIILIRFIKSL